MTDNVEMTKCARCKQDVPVCMAVLTRTENYCSEHCASEDTLDRIRRESR